jgi:Uma2 family endonuclease
MRFSYIMTMSQLTQKATIADLYLVDGKAELIGGRIVEVMPTGRKPNRVAGRIYRSLDDYAIANGRGEAYTDNMGYTVPLLPSGRESFSPDASYYFGPFPANPMKFIHGAPTFSAEVRSDNDYGPEAEVRLAEKRLDYFAAGTLVVWDVDTKNDTIYCYRHDDPDQPVVFAKGDQANAEPAVPGWRMDVASLFA